MDALTAATRALVPAREALSDLGSSNIIEKGAGYARKDADTLGKATEEQMAFMERKMQLDVAFAGTIAPSRLTAQNAGMDAFVDHGRTARSVGAGNCQEFAAAACAVLSGMDDVPAYDAVYLVNGNHIFVAIGEAHHNGNYTKNLGAWNVDAAICDPWADIACLATDYVTEWKARMREWNLAGRMLKGDDNSVLAPVDTVWFDAPTRCDKKSFTRVPPPRRGCCYITTATCLAMGLADDCEALERLRWYRDNVLMTSAAGRQAVAEYYATAPAIVAAIDARCDAARIYQEIYRSSIQPAARAVDDAQYDRAEAIFRSLVDDARARYARD